MTQSMGRDAEGDEMNEYPQDLDRETAEQLLDGADATHRVGIGALSHLLASAAAPAKPHELAGENVAVMAFRAAKIAQKSGFPWRRLLTFKAIAAGVAAVAVGGLAFASTTGIIPGPFKMDPPPVPSRSTTSPTSGHETTTSPTPAETGASAHPSPPSEALHGLCQAYLAKPPGERGKALESPAFSELVAAAGGADNVDAYCGVPPEERPDKSHSPKPSKPAIPPPSPRRVT
ncbi:MAG TPA: hypothetical protein DGT23_21360 [Micromonosporaceae bacterium]|nr:hypothetical protein [Micromonosporaceae bacterium]